VDGNNGFGNVRRLLSFSDEGRHGRWFEAYFHYLKRGRHVVVVFWTVCMIWGACTGMRYIESARDEMTAPKGTRAYEDMQVFNQEFSLQATAAPLIVLISCKVPNCTVACPKDTCMRKKQACVGENAEIDEFSSKITTQILEYSREHDVGYQEEVLGYYAEAASKSRELLKCQFTSESGNATFMVFTGSTRTESRKRYDLVAEVDKHIIPSLNPDPEKYHIGITGLDPMTRDGSEAAVKQSEVIDAFTMPFAFLLLAYMVRSLRLLLISLFNMGVSLLFSFGVLALLTDATGTPPMTTTASFVEVLGLAMSVDYSLFLLRRFRDECKSGRDAEMAIRIMISQAGHVVLMSSLTIDFVFAGFLFMKSTDLMVQGLACVVIVTNCLLVNMTNTPALLLMFPDFFAQFNHSHDGKKEKGFFREMGSGCLSCLSRCWYKCKGICVDVSQDTNSNQQSLLTRHDTEVISSPMQRMLKQRGGPYKGWYFRLLLFVTKWPYNLLTLVSLYVMVIPLAYQAIHLQRNQNLLQAIPRSSESGKIYHEVRDYFPGGTMTPMYVLVEGDQTRNNSIKSNKFFDGLHKLTAEIVHTTGIPVSSFNSIGVANGTLIDYKFDFGHMNPLHPKANMALNPTNTFCKTAQFFGGEFCGLYEFAWRQGVNPGNTSTLITVIVPFDPFTNTTRIESFIEHVYNGIDRFNEKHGKKIEEIHGVYFSGLQVGMVEDMRTSFGEFPALVGITCAVVFTLLGVMLMSAFVVIRLTLTVILPIASMFGLSVLVYQKGILNWTGLAQFQSSGGDGFFWYVPLLTFTICCGLALDYDVLVISRIREHRAAGYEIRAAIIKAMWEINSTVVCAGLIMALAFGGLLIADTMCVNQMSFLLTSNVLFDTFVVQSVVVPCIMSFADGISWWPGKVPASNLVTLEEEVELRNEAFEVFDNNVTNGQVEEGGGEEDVLNTTEEQ